ncbi:hypothetical protein ISS08_02420 [Candidatus Pacearchaeota archaeon]|nr:hypothetical protein [Candidatus Pacearchaeota archaeon]
MKNLEKEFSLTPAIDISLRNFEDFVPRFNQIGIKLDSELSYFNIEGFPPLPVLDFELKSGSKRKIYGYQLFGSNPNGNISINLQQHYRGTISLTSKYHYGEDLNTGDANNLLENIKSVIKLLYSPKKTNDLHPAWNHR